MSTKVKSASKNINDIVKIAYKRGVSLLIDGDSVDQPFPYTWDANTKELVIFLNGLSAEEQEELIPVIREYFDRYGLLMSVQQERVLEEYIEYEDRSPYKDTIELFTGTIPPKDLDALKMSFYIKEQAEKVQPIEDLKSEVRERFGPRGSYIANLCSAGYFNGPFTSHFHKLSKERFSQYYELKVGQELAALFVHTGMTLTTLKNSFIEKLSACSQNGVSKFGLHAIGKRNVDLINSMFDECEDNEWEVEIRRELRMKSANVLEYDIIIP